MSQKLIVKSESRVPAHALVLKQIKKLPGLVAMVRSVDLLL